MAKLHPFAAQGTLLETNITSTQTTLSEASFASLPVVTSPNIIELVFDPYNIYGHIERVVISSHTVGSNNVTVIRAAFPTAQNGTGASVHNSTAGVTEQWFCAPTDQDFIHANLTNLTADDHPQYLKADGSRALTGVLTTAGLTGASGNVNVQGGLLVTGSANIAGGLVVQGAQTVGSNLSVSGILTPTGGVDVPRGRVFATIGSTSNNADAPIPCNGQDFLAAGMTHVSNGLRIPANGQYLVSAQVQVLVPNGTQMWIGAIIFQNSVATVYGNRCEMGGPFDAASSVTDILTCHTGDIIELGSRTSVASSLQFVFPGKYNYISVVQIGTGS